MLKSKEVSTCLIIVKLYSSVYRTSADRIVAINCHKCLDTLFAEPNNIKPTKRLRTTGAYENASVTFVRPISVSHGSHLGLFHARTTVSSRLQCYFSRISSNCTVIPYSIFPYLHFPTLLTRTCIFHPYTYCHFVLQFSIFAFSSTCNFSAPL